MSDRRGTTRQKKLGPAPFASFEDLSGEDLSSPESKGYRPMPEICEEYSSRHGHNDASASSTSTAQTPTTPRIDVEGASSPSQETSGDSTPERELFSMTDRTAGNLCGSFLEGVADVDLRSSAEELRIPYSAAAAQQQQARLLASGNVAPSKRKVSWDSGDHHRRQQQKVDKVKHHQTVERKVSGGTMMGKMTVNDSFFFSDRLSSTSPSRKIRRSPSPHKMRLETSFVGPKASEPQATEEDELELSSVSSRRPSLLNPTTWFGEGNSRSTSPICSPVSPGGMRSFMVQYATEPRSRPTSPMGWLSAAPSPTPDRSGSFSSSRWLSSPRCERRASSPHRTLVETSFCGSQQKILQVPDDDVVAPRGASSPQPSLLGGSLLSMQSLQPVKYATEPRSRPTSPTPTAGSRSFLSLSQVPPDSRRGSVGRCPSPMIETSFCGPKQIVRMDSIEKDPVRSTTGSISEASVTHSSDLRRPSIVSTQGESSNSSLRPVRYMTEPRSRPVSPSPSLISQTEKAAGSGCLDSPQISRAQRSASPHRMVVETSFVSKTANRQDSIVDHQPGPSGRDATTITAEVSIHALPVQYATEPRSRPVSPCLLNNSNHNPPSLGTPDPERRSLRPSSRCASPALIETSFCGAVAPRQTEDTDAAIPSGTSTSQQLTVGSNTIQPVKYSTEPRSRPVSPSPNMLGTCTSALTDSLHRVTRSPSPSSRIVETSFCGTRAIPSRENSLAKSPTGNQDEEQEPDLDSESSDTSIDSITEVTIARHHHSATAVEQPDTTSRDETSQDENVDFVQNWPDVPPVHLKTFEQPSKSGAASSSEETMSPLSHNGHAHVRVPAASTAAPASPMPSPRLAGGRNLPKPVACPKPPTNFPSFPQSDSSAQSSPLASPALFRRNDINTEFSETASPSPSSPFPSRRTSLSSSFRRGSAAATEEAVVGGGAAATPQMPRKTSIAASMSSRTSGASPVEEAPEAASNKKGRSVLSALFGKRPTNKKADKNETKKSGLSLPVQSRDSSPGRSFGESGPSGDDLDDEEGDGFRHQVLLGVPDEPEEQKRKKSSSDEPAATAITLPKEELGLVHQESVEDEEGDLPYVPTTLPIERPIAPLITPVRARLMTEVKTTPTERPRCSVSFGPRSINDYIISSQQSLDESQKNEEADLPGHKIKIRVSLPKSDREGSVDETAGSVTSPPPIKVSVGTVKWEAFTEQVFTRNSRRRTTQTSEEETSGDAEASSAEQAVAVSAVTISHWVNVEDIPEPIKEPKTIKVVSTATTPNKGPRLDKAEERKPSPENNGTSLAPASRKDSVSSETALLREIDEAEEDRSPQEDVDSDVDSEAGDPSVSNGDSEQLHLKSSSSAELECHLDEDAGILATSSSVSRPHLLAVSSAPFGMDLDVHSNRSSMAITSDVPSPDELSISAQ